MSGAEEGKHDAAPAAAPHDPVDADAEGVILLPDDAWGVVVAFLPSKDSVSLSSSCSQLRETVLGSMRSIVIVGSLDEFPSYDFTSLERIEVRSEVDLPTAVDALEDCPKLRQLELLADSDYFNWEGLLPDLPRFSLLSSLSIGPVDINGELGEALASCPLLTDITLHSDALECSDRGMAFLEELSSLTQLRRLNGLTLTDRAAESQLCAALACWPALEVLSVLVLSDSMRRPDRAPSAVMNDVAATVADGCPSLQQLVLSATAKCDLQAEAAAALARLPKLQLLALSSIQLDAGFFTQLAASSSLQQLSLQNVVDNDGIGDSLALFVEGRQLSTLDVSFRDLPHATAMNWLTALSACSARFVQLAFRIPHAKWTRAEWESTAAAAADAICLSDVRQWTLTIHSALLPLLRRWDGRTPAAAVQKLQLTALESWEDAAADELVPLLLRCLRSCPSLTWVKLNWTRVPVETLKQLVAAVKAEPLTPLLLVASTGSSSLCEEYAADELERAGLKIVSY